MRMCVCVLLSGHRTWRYIWHARVGLVLGRLFGQVILGPAIDFALCASINYLHSPLSICDSDVNWDCDSPANQGHHGKRLLYRWSQILITLLWPNMVKFQFQAVTRHGRNLIRFTALLQLFLLLQSLLINSARWVAGSGSGSGSDGSSSICLWYCCYFCCCLCCVGFCCWCWWRCRRHCACFDWLHFTIVLFVIRCMCACVCD